MAANPAVTYPRRGEIWFVNFDPTLGAEIKKTRPALIVQNDIDNRYSPITIVAGITSSLGPKLYPTNVRVKPPEGGLSLDSVVQLNQVRSVDKRRLIKRLGVVRSETMERVDKAIMISFGIIIV